MVDFTLIYSGSDAEMRKKAVGISQVGLGFYVDFAVFAMLVEFLILTFFSCCGEVYQLYFMLWKNIENTGFSDCLIYFISSSLAFDYYLMSNVALFRALAGETALVGGPLGTGGLMMLKVAVYGGGLFILFQSCTCGLQNFTWCGEGGCCPSWCHSWHGWYALFMSCRFFVAVESFWAFVLFFVDLCVNGIGPLDVLYILQCVFNLIRMYLLWDHIKEAWPSARDKIMKLFGLVAAEKNVKGPPTP